MSIYPSLLLLVILLPVFIYLSLAKFVKWYLFGFYDGIRTWKTIDDCEDAKYNRILSTLILVSLYKRTMLEVRPRTLSASNHKINFVEVDAAGNTYPINETKEKILAQSQDSLNKAVSGYTFCAELIEFYEFKLKEPKSSQTKT